MCGSLLDNSLGRVYNEFANPKIHKRGGMRVSTVRLHEGESFDSLLRRFNKKVQSDRVLSEVRRRRFFEKPSVVRKRKKAAKLRKSRRQTFRDQRHLG